MPSYHSPHWDDDAAAEDHLIEMGFSVNRGVIRPPITDLEHRFDTRTNEAINYLCGEWDYAYEGYQKLA